MLRKLKATEACAEAEKVWRKVLRAAEAMRDELVFEWKFDPLGYNETASVGFLTGAAGRAGLLPLPEFKETNDRLPAGRTHAGRCDLWLGDSRTGNDLIVEAKQGWYLPNTRRRLVTALNGAVQAAFHRARTEAKSRYACLICVPWTPEMARRRDGTDRFPSGTYEPDAFAPARRYLAGLVEQSDLAFRMDGTERPVTFIFRRVPPRTTGWEGLIFT